MVEIQKSVLGSVRLDSDVWEAVRSLPSSLNVYLRAQLRVGLKRYEGDVFSPETEKRIAAQVRPRKQSRRAKAIQELAASDLTAHAVGREDIEYGSHEETPRGQHVASMGKRAIREKGDKSR